MTKQTTPAVQQSSKKQVGGGTSNVADESVKQLQGELAETKMNLDTIEKERDFYFSKLRDIELYLQVNSS